MYQIRKEFSFEAAHKLTTLHPEHKCMRLHGHSYRVEVVIKCSELDKHSFITDFSNLRFVKNYLKEYVDHRYLNEVFEFETTAENLAFHFYKWIKGQVAVTLKRDFTCEVIVWETAKSYAKYWE